MSSMKTMTNMSKYCLNAQFIKSMKDAKTLNVTFSDSELVKPGLRNRTGSPQGDMMGLMNPLSRRSFKLSVNSLSSGGSILYGGIDIGLVLGRKSILKSISHSGETPKRSLGNTSGISHTTGTDSRLGVSELESST
ncbi:hypothetical protein CQW23_26466 [Capsicum baccatum]|uniref:Uncharacterized protein n=1 Tax=Capsicum baccatum TaxID=33114 RepID=A0A2G2VNX4_CAPBA|nr:hypothetical protein CQW23_26466 [Capsicum baccatum]